MQRAGGAASSTPAGGKASAARDAGGVAASVAHPPVHREAGKPATGEKESSEAAALRHQMKAVQDMMAARTARICIRYGRDKVFALLQSRERLRLQRAMARWRYAAAAAAAEERMERQRMQTAVAADQTRAERGAFEQARMQLARERKALMLQSALRRWRDAAQVQRMADDRAAAMSVATQLAHQLREARAAAEAATAQVAAERARAAADGGELVAELHGALAAAGAAAGGVGTAARPASGSVRVG
jgi:hypothetical protein